MYEYGIYNEELNERDVIFSHWNTWVEAKAHCKADLTGWTCEYREYID